MSALERRLAAITRVDPQRWSLGAAAVIAALAATIAAGFSGGGQSLLVSVVVLAFAVGSAIRPETHTAIGVLLVVVWQWLATTDDPLSPLVVVVALALFVFHSLVALLTVTPVPARVDPVVARRWRWRCAAVAMATLAMWALVTALESGQARGSVPLTLLGFVTIIALLAALRRSLTSAAS